MKRFFLFSLTAALLGAVIVAWFSPQAIAWYFAPPVDIINCKRAVDWGLETYRKCMVGGSLMGFIAGSVLYFAFKSKKVKPAPTIQS